MTLKNKNLEALILDYTQTSNKLERKIVEASGDIASYIDHTLLKPDATLVEIDKHCQDAINNKFKTVCVHPCHVSFVKNILNNSSVMPITVVGFPFGLNTTETKVFETKNSIQLGALEIDMVLNLNNLKSKKYDEVLDDIAAVVKAAGKIPVKVIVETAYLSLEEKIAAAACVKLSGARFIKTSTGFGPKGAQIDDILLFKNLLKNEVLIKASGGIKTYDQAIAFIQAGSDRIGTSSGIDILQRANSSNKDY